MSDRKVCSNCAFADREEELEPCESCVGFSNWTAKEPTPTAPYDQSAKFDAGKTPYELLHWPFVEGVVNVLKHGAAKYSADSWQKVPQSRRRYFAAAIRHILAWWRGEELDPESGLPHLHHAACDLMFLASGLLESP